MENQQQQQKTSNPIMWLILVIIIILLGVGAYFLFFQEETNTNNSNTTLNTNTVVNENTNTVANSNTNIDTNTNSTANTNTAINSNTNTATNTNIDISGWKTYTDEEYGFSFSYPNGWILDTSQANGKINVNPSTFHEAFTLFRVSEGVFQEALNLINSTPGLNVLFSETGDKYILNNYSGKTVSDGGYSTYAIIEQSDYSIIIQLPGDLIDRDGTYKDILNSFVFK